MNRAERHKVCKELEKVAGLERGLKPCYDCGGLPSVTLHASLDLDGPSRIVITCRRCGRYGPMQIGNVLEEVKRRWNEYADPVGWMYA